MGSEIRIEFQTFKIENVNGLPPGIEWECNLAPECIYDVGPDNSEPDSVGCVRLFGFPNVLSDYVVEVDIVAEVDFVGDQAASFDIPISIVPCFQEENCFWIHG